MIKIKPKSRIRPVDRQETEAVGIGHGPCVPTRGVGETSGGGPGRNKPPHQPSDPGIQGSRCGVDLADVGAVEFGREPVDDVNQVASIAAGLQGIISMREERQGARHKICAGRCGPGKNIEKRACKWSKSSPSQECLAPTAAKDGSSGDRPRCRASRLGVG